MRKGADGTGMAAEDTVKGLCGVLYSRPVPLKRDPK